MILHSVKIATLAVAILMVAVGCSRSYETATPGPVLVGGDATVDSLLAAYRGEWVLVNIWATWCRPCVAETPELVQFAHRTKLQPLKMLGLSVDYFIVDDTTALRKVTEFQMAQRIPYPNLVYTGTLDQLTARLDLPGPLPTTILFDPEGNPVKQIVGMLDDSDFEWIAGSLGED
jgi:thiol-disulfide isomerase/thioredoxin